MQGDFTGESLARELLEAGAVRVAGENIGVVSGERRDRERLAAASRAQVDDLRAGRGTQSGRRILARRVLNLEAALGIGGMLRGGGFGRQAPAVGRAGDRFTLGKKRRQIVALGLDPVRAKVERSAREHGVVLAFADERVEEVDQRLRREPGLGARFVGRDRRGAIGRTVEQRRQRPIGIDAREHRRAPRHGRRANDPDRVIDMRADRAAVLRPRIAARAHRLGENGVGWRPALARRSGDGVENLDRGLKASGGGHRIKPLPLAGRDNGGASASPDYPAG